MTSKPGTIPRQKTKRLGHRRKTGEKVTTYPARGSTKHRPRGPSDTPAESTKARMVPLRLGVPEGLKEDLEDIVIRLGVCPSVSEMTRHVLVKERDKRLEELRRVRRKDEVMSG